MIQYGHLVGHVTRHLPPLYYWLSATLSFLPRISNSITLLPNGQKTALFCVPQLLLLVLTLNQNLLSQNPIPSIPAIGPIARILLNHCGAHSRPQQRRDELPHYTQYLESPLEALSFQRRSNQHTRFFHRQSLRSTACNTFFL